LKLDFSGVEEFVPVPEGRYLAEVITSAEGLSKAANQRKWTLKLRVSQALGGDEEPIGKEIKWDVSLQPKALWKVQQTLTALGESVSIEDTEFEFDAANYVGRECTLIVGKTQDPVYGSRTAVQRLEAADAFEMAVA